MFKDYFAALFDASRTFIDELALPRTAQPLEVLLGDTRSLVAERSGAIVAGFRGLRPRLRGTGGLSSGRAAGMNTIGMLCDRLTVLAMREWVLERRKGSPPEAERLRQTQIAELLDALGEVRPGHSSFTQKLTPLQFETAARQWEETYFGLLSTNVLLWEAQEILYAGHIAELACEELRRYIAWFSEGNIKRNHFIAGCETHFWQVARGKDAQPESFS